MSVRDKDIALHPALHGQHPSSWGHVVVDVKYVNTSEKPKPTSQQLQLSCALFAIVYRRED